MRRLILLAIIASVMNTASAELPAADSTLRHVVLLKFKNDAGANGIKAVEDAFKVLPSKIHQIKGFEWGTNSSPENLNDGLTHCFFVSFDSEKGRDEYLVHPAHKEFVEVLKPVLDKVVVLDYWSRK